MPAAPAKSPNLCYLFRMDILTRLLAIPPLPEALLPLPGAAGAYLVGGALRDGLLGRAVTDFDFATPGDPTVLAQSFARRCAGRWFLLDPGRRQSRVVWKAQDGNLLTFDFAPFRAADLEGDLRGRDFTVNALALSLGDRRLHDPLQGRADLAGRQLRTCAPESFAEDPLRVLRAVRLAVTLDFSLDALTRKQAAAHANLLGRVAAERRGDELVSIANHPRALEGLALLEALEITPYIFGRGGDAGQGWVKRSGAGFRHLAILADWLGDRRPELAALLTLPVSRSLQRLGRLRLACLLAAGPFDPAALDGFLALGRDNLRALQVLVPIALQGLEPPADLATRRARARWAALGPFVADRLLLGAALAGTEAERDALLNILEAYLSLERGGRIPDLVAGDHICRICGLEPGPRLGQIVDRLRAAELEGTVETPDQARKFLISLREKTVDKKNGKPL